ncbi:MAG: stage IV sporulation protein A [Oscillospiraceae bacterium]|nr:stage IV sporulation protein A [Oscillospiraceae bacterium]
MTNNSIYQDMAARTDGSVYIAVVGPVRTGKSTFIKRMMERIVIPNIENTFKKERARDELPQSGSGKTIMTAEPKFVPEEPVEICPDGTARFSVRMIDSVGYMIPGVIGVTEEGEPRMVTTPWFDQPIPLTEAAELGTKKVMEDHCSVGLVVTTDGTVTDIPRQDYAEAEARSIQDMQRTGKPFAVLINSTNPNGAAAQELRQQLEETYQVGCMAVDCMALEEQDFASILAELLLDFPITEYRIWLPRWVETLEPCHEIKKNLYQKIREAAAGVERLRDAEAAVREVSTLETVQAYHIPSLDLSTGTVNCVLDFPEELFYSVLSEKSGFTVQDDGDLLMLLQSLSSVKKEYDQVQSALEEVRATGYGIVMPTPEQMHLEVPEIVRKGSSYGVRLRASAPSIHMMRADIQTEISPIVGDEKQSEDLLNYLLGEYDGDTEKLWESNIFGKSVFDLVNEGLMTKMKRMPESARHKMKDSLTRMVNEGCTGLICIMF